MAYVHEYSIVDLQYDGMSGIEMGNFLQRHNCPIKELSLCCEEASPSVLGKILAGLCNNVSITRLDLSYNQVDDYGAEILANALLNNHTLLSIDLSFNKISDRGALKLSDALWNNRTLKKLRLHNNPLTDDGVAVLLKSLWNNDVLYFLEVSRIGRESINHQALIDFIEYLLKHKRKTQQKLTIRMRNLLF